MKINLLKERDSKLLNRKRLTYEAFFPGKTPSKEEIKGHLAKHLKTDQDLVSVLHIYQRFGSGKAKIIVHVYKNKEDFERFEKKKIKKEKEESKQAPKPGVKEAPKPEAKQEQPKEEPKKEAEAKEKPKEEPKKEQEAKKEKPKKEIAPPKENGKEEESKEQSS